MKKRVFCCSIEKAGYKSSAGPPDFSVENAGVQQTWSYCQPTKKSIKLKVLPGRVLIWVAKVIGLTLMVILIFFWFVEKFTNLVNGLNVVK